MNLGTGVERALIRTSDLTLVGMTNDGQLISFLSNSNLTSARTGGREQLFSVRADGSGLRQITQDPAGLTEATLARGGAVAYAVTASGRLLKIDMASGTSTALIGRTLTLQTPSSSTGTPPVAGSAFCVTGAGFADSSSSASAPLPASLGSFQLLLDGNPLPLLSVAPAQGCFQIPWDTGIDPHTLTVVANPDPTFQSISTTPFQLYYSAFPNFLFLGPGYPVSVGLTPYALASHEDFRGLLTRQDPARPGEIIQPLHDGFGPGQSTGADRFPRAGQSACRHHVAPQLPAFCISGLAKHRRRALRRSGPGNGGLLPGRRAVAQKYTRFPRRFRRRLHGESAEQ